ncbi:MAG: Rieske (2Fe-2S) protein [Comamonas sp.]|jgi:3-phenylpropionate/trans-cinnamate dioxygenase ferredoxin subunit|nr:Rieske (2Fe-2S) protein [Comamonas sp.]
MPVLQTPFLVEPPLLAAGAAQDLPPGGRKLVFAPGGETVLLLNVEGEFYAMENSCPHAGASMASGSCDRHVLTCPAHGLKFDIRNGRCTASPQLLIPLYEVLELEGQLWLKRPSAEN